MRLRHLYQRFYLLVLGCMLIFMAIAMFLRHSAATANIGIGAIVLIAVVISAAAYPLARRLSNRLLRLQETVVAFGDGQLQRRAQVEGNDEIAALASGFNVAADRIEALVVANRTLLANASHELRTPLTRIRLAAELLMRQPDQRRHAELTADLRELDDLLEEILMASRLDAINDHQQHLEPVDLAALLAEECARYPECELDCAVSASGAQARPLKGDPRLLRRLVRNLLENSRRHGASPSEVSLCLEPNRYVLEVSDAGGGVPEEHHERVFEPFFRSHAADENMGSGLGLSLVRQIARRHGGDAICEPKPSGGSRFRITLPLDQG